MAGFMTLTREAKKEEREAWELDLYAHKLNTVLNGDSYCEHLLPLLDGKDLLEKLRDGTILACFLNSVPGHENRHLDMNKLKIPKKNQDNVSSPRRSSLNGFQCVENNAMMLDAAKEMNIRLVGIGPLDFVKDVENKKSIILGMIRQINQLHAYELITRSAEILEGIRARVNQFDDPKRGEKSPRKSAAKYFSLRQSVFVQKDKEVQQSASKSEAFACAHAFTRRFLNDILEKAKATERISDNVGLAEMLNDGLIYSKVLAYLDTEKKCVNDPLLIVNNPLERTDLILANAQEMGIACNIQSSQLIFGGDVAHFELISSMIVFVQNKELDILRAQGIASAADEEKVLTLRPAEARKLLKYRSSSNQLPPKIEDIFTSKPVEVSKINSAELHSSEELSAKQETSLGLGGVVSEIQSNNLLVSRSSGDSAECYITEQSSIPVDAESMMISTTTKNQSARIESQAPFTVVDTTKINANTDEDILKKHNFESINVEKEAGVQFSQEVDLGTSSTAELEGVMLSFDPATEMAQEQGRPIIIEAAAPWYCPAFCCYRSQQIQSKPSAR